MGCASSKNSSVPAQQNVPSIGGNSNSARDKNLKDPKTEDVNISIDAGGTPRAQEFKDVDQSNILTKDSMSSSINSIQVVEDRSPELYTKNISPKIGQSEDINFGSGLLSQPPLLEREHSNNLRKDVFSPSIQPIPEVEDSTLTNTADKLRDVAANHEIESENISNMEIKIDEITSIKDKLQSDLLEENTFEITTGNETTNRNIPIITNDISSQYITNIVTNNINVQNNDTNNNVNNNDTNNNINNDNNNIDDAINKNNNLNPEHNINEVSAQNLTASRPVSLNLDKQRVSKQSYLTRSSSVPNRIESPNSNSSPISESNSILSNNKKIESKLAEAAATGSLSVAKISTIFNTIDKESTSPSRPLLPTSTSTSRLSSGATSIPNHSFVPISSDSEKEASKITLDASSTVSSTVEDVKVSTAISSTIPSTTSTSRGNSIKNIHSNSSELSLPLTSLDSNRTKQDTKMNVQNDEEEVESEESMMRDLMKLSDFRASSPRGAPTPPPTVTHTPLYAPSQENYIYSMNENISSNTNSGGALARIKDSDYLKLGEDVSSENMLVDESVLPTVGVRSSGTGYGEAQGAPDSAKATKDTVSRLKERLASRRKANAGSLQ